MSHSESAPETTKKKSRFPKELLDQLMEVVSPEGHEKGPTATLKELTAAVVNRALEAELTHHLDYEEGEQPPETQSNRRNGYRTKTLRTDFGDVLVEVPRDREGSFEPQLIEALPRSQLNRAGRF